MSGVGKSHYYTGHERKKHCSVQTEWNENHVPETPEYSGANVRKQRLLGSSSVHVHPIWINTESPGARAPKRNRCIIRTETKHSLFDLLYHEYFISRNQKSINDNQIRSAWIMILSWPEDDIWKIWKNWQNKQLYFELLISVKFV
jgi:hypothetical protein